MKPLVPQPFKNVAAGAVDNMRNPLTFSRAHLHKYIKHYGAQGVKWSWNRATYQTRIEDWTLKCGITGERTTPRLSAKKKRPEGGEEPRER
jgi:hypothetical protein